MKKQKIEWQGGILESYDDTHVKIGSKKKKEPLSQPEAAPIHGKCSFRVEKKGRAGNPVVVLFNFSDSEAKNKSSLKLLCSKLKAQLACGGTIEDNEIILIIKDIERVKKVFENITK